MYLAHHRQRNGSLISTREFKTLHLTLHASPFQHLHIGYPAKYNSHVTGEGAERERCITFDDYRQRKSKIGQCIFDLKGFVWYLLNGWTVTWWMRMVNGMQLMNAWRGGISKNHSCFPHIHEWSTEGCCQDQPQDQVVKIKSVLRNKAIKVLFKYTTEIASKWRTTSKWGWCSREG